MADRPTLTTLCLFAVVFGLQAFGGVLGGSGAIFALMGYILVANRASNRVLSWLPLGATGMLLLFGVLAAAVTLATAAPGVALVAHFTGFLVGAVAGESRLLHTGADTKAARA